MTLGAAVTVPPDTDPQGGSQRVFSPTLMDSTPTPRKLLILDTFHGTIGKFVDISEIDTADESSSSLTSRCVVRYREKITSWHIKCPILSQVQLLLLCNNT